MLSTGMCRFARACLLVHATNRGLKFKFPLQTEDIWACSRPGFKVEVGIGRLRRVRVRHLDVIARECIR